ncbi:hypothetical protein ACQPZJ_35465 [Actinoplanes sp. CA-054009]
MATFGAVVALVAGVLGLVALVGILWARFRTSADETTALLWKGNAEAEKARADRLEAELAAQRLQMADLIRRVETLEQENRVLRSINDYRDEINALRADISAALSQLPCQLIQKEDK